MTESSDESEEHNKMFDLDNIEEDSDNREAVAYLRSVRKQAQDAPKYTYFDDSNFNKVPTDKRYLEQSTNTQLMLKQKAINHEWQTLVIEQFMNMKSNIEKLKEWKQSIDIAQYNQAIINRDIEEEEQILSSFQQKQKFTNLIDKSEPTLSIMVMVDYSVACKLLQWAIPTQSVSETNCFWIYCLLTQLEDPIDGDTLADINQFLTRLLKAREHQDEARFGILISVYMLRYLRRQLFSKEVFDLRQAHQPMQMQQATKCLVLHPVFHPNKGPEMELYMAEEAVGLAKALFWAVSKGPFWQEEFTRRIRKSQGRPEEKEIEEQKVSQAELRKQMASEGWALAEQAKIRDGEYVSIPYFSGIYQKGSLLLDLSSESDDDLAHEWRNKIIRESIAKSSLVKVPRIHSSTFFSKGKLLTIGDFIKENGINAIFINTELSPLQTRNLELQWNRLVQGQDMHFANNPENTDVDSELESDAEPINDSFVKVFDRYTMILQIFAKRSSQGIAKLQIELSFLKFARTRLVRSGSAFTSLTQIFQGDLMSAREVQLEVVSAKQRRGRSMGEGETAIEMQRRLIDEKTSKVKKQLDIELTQQVRVKTKAISNVPKIALIGYTNAGKSALLNCILQKDTVESRDLLFQTLSTTMRKIKLASGQKAIMLDTIGFISDLPHELVASFKSTLSEVQSADLVLHIRDISHPCTNSQKETVLNVLKQLGFGQDFYTNKMVYIDINKIEVWNKIDLLKTPIDYDQLEASDYPVVPISAVHRTNIQQLLKVMEEKSNIILDKKLYRLKHTLDDHYNRLKWLYDNGNITSIDNEIQTPPIKKGGPTLVEFDVLLDTITYNRYMATYQPELREQRKKLKGMPPAGW